MKRTKKTALLLALLLVPVVARGQTTTTTLPGPSFPSITSRLDDLSALLRTASGMGKATMQNQVARAQKNAGLAAAAAATSPRKARAKLKQVVTALRSLNFRLRSHAARHSMDPEVRKALHDMAEPLLADVRTLQQSLG